MTNVTSVPDPAIVTVMLNDLGTELKQRAADPDARQRALAGDDSLVDEALRAVCDRAGLSPGEYRSAIAADPSLIQLERLTIDEALTGPVDPGPHDAISRESPSGTTANTHLNDELASAERKDA